jgi:hypothetical protein
MLLFVAIASISPQGNCRKREVQAWKQRSTPVLGSSCAGSIRMLAVEGAILNLYDTVYRLNRSMPDWNSSRDFHNSTSTIAFGALSCDAQRQIGRAHRLNSRGVTTKAWAFGPKPGAKNSDSSRYSMTWRELSLFLAPGFGPGDSKDEISLG